VVDARAALRIVYFGTPAFAVPSLEAMIRSQHRVVAIVSQPDRPRGRGQQLQPTPTHRVALAYGIPILQPQKIRDETFLSAIRGCAPDLGVVAAFGRILPDALLAIPRLGMINVHASLLPKYRGAAPIHRAVLAGEKETGVSIMRVVTELDAGPTFAMTSTPIGPDETSGEVEARLAGIGAEALIAVVENLAAGRAIETPQDASRATFAPKVTKEESDIAWTAPAEAVHNKVRGLQPWPLASTHLGGVRYVLRRTEWVTERPGPDPGLAERREWVTERPGPDPGLAERSECVIERPGSDPGRVVRAGGGDLIVACGHGTTLRILEIQPEGRRAMTAREFLAGRRLTTADRFGT
jgi:methionyl-tRNA formyltransferase